MGKASAPGKVILTGEHSVVYGKPALAAALDLRCQVTIQDKKSEGLMIHARDLDKTFEYNYENLNAIYSGDAVYPKFDNLAMAVMTVLNPDKIALDLEITSDVPIGAGLGSSAATSVAIIGAILDHLDMEFDPRTIGKLAYDAEKIAHGNPSGIDNTVTAIGGLLRYQAGKVEAYPIDDDIPLVIANTNIPRNTKTLVESVARRQEKFPLIMNAVLDQMGVLSDQIEELIKSRQYEQAGELMDINQGLLDAIGVNHYRLGQLIQIAREAGALGAKLTGAGGGGCMIAMVNDDHRDDVVEQLKLPGIDVYKTAISSRGVLQHE